SAALLSGWARRTSETPVYLVATRRIHDEPTSNVAMEAFAKASKRVALPSLSAEATAELVGALFAGDPRTGRLSALLHDVTSGNPLSCIEVARSLMERGLVRYIRGVWVLPGELSKEDIPQNLSVALAARFEGFGQIAERVASALALHEGPLSNRVLSMLNAGGTPESLRAARAELAACGIISESDKGLRLANAAWRDVISSRLSAEERIELHRQIGEALLGEGSDDVGVAVD